jgi:hypothetical protein
MPEFPGWLPPPVKQMAVALLDIEASQPIPEQRATILRLACDPRMEEVWSVLDKAQVISPTAWATWLKWFGKMGEHDPRDPADMALALFFYKACWLHFFGIVMARPRNRYDDGGDLYRFMAQVVDARNGLISPNDIPGVSMMLNLLDIDVRFRRDRGNGPARYYAMHLASTTEKLFGQVLLTTVATTTSVMLDLKPRHEISRANVQYWTSTGCINKREK